MGLFEITYTVPASTGTVCIAAQTEEEAVALFEKTSVSKLFDQADGEDPEVDLVKDITPAFRKKLKKAMAARKVAK